ncbi:MAG: lactate racemase domain-containing protein [Candidatus Hodarchaeales archaeon]|jgi:nickel-dependent lactate racemase
MALEYLKGKREKKRLIRTLRYPEVLRVEAPTYLDTPIWYEEDRISFFVPSDANCKYLQTPQASKLDDIVGALEQAVNSPLDSPPLYELITTHYAAGKQVVILVDDHTRPNIHTKALLPILTEKMVDYGINERDLRLLIATGTHPPPTPAQIRERILGQLYDLWKDRLWTHDCDDLATHVHLGISPNKTPILIDKRALESCLIIPLSDSEYHYFAGVAGSVKLFVPGISGRQTVRVNHSRIFDLETGFKTPCRMGNLEDNLCIQDIRNIVKIVMEDHPIFVIDAIMQKGEFIDIFAGNPLNIHDNALDALARVRNVTIQEKADLIIVAKPSTDFYQLGKGFNAASHAVKPEGQIILLGACADGIGPDDYLETMNAVKQLPYKEAMQWVIQHKCTDTTFEIGIQNAVDLFRILQLTDGKIFVYSELDPQLLKETFRVNSLNTAHSSVQEVLRSFVQKFLADCPNGLIHVFEDFNMLTLIQEDG